MVFFTMTVILRCVFFGMSFISLSNRFCEVNFCVRFVRSSRVKVFFSLFFICIVNQKKKKKRNYIVMLLDCSNQTNRPCIEVNKQSQWTPLASVVVHSSCVCPSLPSVLLSILVARGRLAEKTPRPQGKQSKTKQ